LVAIGLTTAPVASLLAELCLHVGDGPLKHLDVFPKDIIAVLAPICVDKFRRAQDAEANLVKLNAINYSYVKGAYVRQGGLGDLAQKQRAKFSGGASLRRTARQCRETGHLSMPPLAAAARGGCFEG
jgi:hypothetical protein